MNYLVIKQNEVFNNLAKISKPRSTELIKRHNLVMGITLSCLVYGGKIGKGKIVRIEPELIIELNLDRDKLIKKDINLVVGLSRPQTIKKVISASVTMGVQNLFFLKSEQTEKSYLDSKIFLPENLEQEIILGMEQAGDSLPPNIHIKTHFLPFTDFLKDKNNENFYNNIMAIPSSQRQFKEVPNETPCFIVIGPEKGWNDFETSKFKDLGFIDFNLGQRILRTEQAVITVLGKFL